jgi:hypothetical protein
LNSANAAGEGYAIFGRFYSPHPPQSPTPTPTPGVDIFDHNLAKVVTGTTESSIVGQDQTLTALAAQVGETLTNCNWTLAGNVVGGYNADGTASTAAQTTNLIRTQFYWIGSGQNVASVADPVSVTCDDQSGNHVSASATYNVNQPTVTITATYNTTTGNLTGPNTMPTPCATPTPTPTGQWSDGVLLSNFSWSNQIPCGSESLSFGNPEGDNFHPGVAWSYGANVPTGGSGTIAMIQLKNTSRTGVTTSGSNWSDSANTNGSWCLDTGPQGYVFYNGQGLSVSPGPNTLAQQTDSPSLNLTYYALASANQRLQFQDYFMYQPSNDTVGSSIYVTLGTLMNWSTNSSAAEQNNIWTFSTQSTGNFPTNGASASTLPTWSC